MGRDRGRSHSRIERSPTRSRAYCRRRCRGTRTAARRNRGGASLSRTPSMPATARFARAPAAPRCRCSRCYPREGPGSSWLAVRPPKPEWRPRRRSRARPSPLARLARLGAPSIRVRRLGPRAAITMGSLVHDDLALDGCGLRAGPYPCYAHTSVRNHVSPSRVTRAVTKVPPPSRRS